MDEQLERIERNTRAKENINIILSDTVNPINTLFSPPLILNSDGNYEIALLELDTYYTFPNITEKNNTFKYRKVDSFFPLHQTLLLSLPPLPTPLLFQCTLSTEY